MPYRFHPTKRGLYKLAAEKAAELSWLELPWQALCLAALAISQNLLYAVPVPAAGG